MATNDSTFTRFAKLPKELRDEIWTAAIRPDQPGVHYFTIYNRSDEKESSTIGDDAAFIMPHPEEPDVPSAVAAPRCNRSEPNARSWITSNPSTYLIDGGLLTACKESREVMDKHLRALLGVLMTKQVTPILRHSDKNYNQEKDPDAAVTASFVQHGERRYFRVKPELDLFVLQPYDFDTLDDWWHFGYSAYIFGKPHVGHIALEYGPKWASDFESEVGFSYCADGALGCVSRATTNENTWVENLWFIDYRIRRCPEESLLLDKRHIFHGVGCRYVEVQESDPGWDWNQYYGRDNAFSFDFHLYEDLREHFEREGHNWGPAIGILACEREL
ncbi:hypothetical protein DL764_003405 [Monosporascus ibericus]|uniref:2EXR domain-containing protein n=1 Tax=Monosporascus ibericus TaxID=155417 RepID=A0A4Q4TIE7_9PEZI|nr:hypothetical protein DL764_003405 [Monosporascus ibericus]